MSGAGGDAFGRPVTADRQAGSTESGTEASWGKADVHTARQARIVHTASRIPSTAGTLFSTWPRLPMLWAVNSLGGEWREARGSIFF